MEDVGTVPSLQLVISNTKAHLSCKPLHWFQFQACGHRWKNVFFSQKDNQNKLPHGVCFQFSSDFSRTTHYIPCYRGTCIYDSPRQCVFEPLYTINEQRRQCSTVSGKTAWLNGCLSAQIIRGSSVKTMDPAKLEFQISLPRYSNVLTD